MGRSRRAERHTLAESVAWDHHGIARRQQLVSVGITKDEIRHELDAQRWFRLGRHTVGVTVREATGRARWWWAVWEAGSGAALDGVTALLAAGLRGWSDDTVHVSVPRGRRAHVLPGVIVHRPRPEPERRGAGVPRVCPVTAVIHAAHWARTDRAAATLVAMAVQQRLVPPSRLVEQWATVRRSSRRQLLERVVADVCDGAHALGELDFARLCRERGLPEPTRQAFRAGSRGRRYLDAWWEQFGVHAEIDGAHHGSGLVPVDDALRQNDVALEGAITLRVPVLGLHVAPEQFLDQVEAALRGRGWTG
jgi:hypothetical protein